MKTGHVIVVASLVLMAQVAAAGLYTFEPTPPDLGDLDHYKAYEWGIEPNIPEDEVITAASLLFRSIRNWDNNDNDLYVTLLDSANVGVSIYTDNQGGGDYFASLGPELVHYEDLPNTSQDLLYDFDEAELDTLNDYVADNNFGLGIDPDCHYWNCGIKLTLETEQAPPPPPPIPEPLAGSLLLGGIGMIVARRKRR